MPPIRRSEYAAGQRIAWISRVSRISIITTDAAAAITFAAAEARLLSNTAGLEVELFIVVARARFLSSTRYCLGRLSALFLTAGGSRERPIIATRAPQSLAARAPAEKALLRRIVAHARVRAGLPSKFIIDGGG